MNNVRQYLKSRRKAELQAIHQFWFPGEPMVTTREELESRRAAKKKGKAKESGGKKAQGPVLSPVGSKA